MNRTFNNGIGMVLVIAPEHALSCTELLREAGETVYTIGVDQADRSRRGRGDCLIRLGYWHRYIGKLQSDRGANPLLAVNGHATVVQRHDF
jgi:hypothetical protein